MNATSSSPAPDDYEFDRLDRFLAGRDFESALGFLEQWFAGRKQFGALFEVLKVKARRQVGLPGAATEGELMDASTQEALEKLLFEACGRVGELLFRDGHAAMGWRYYQLAGDRNRAAQLLRLIPPTAENAAELIDVGLGSRVSPVYGIELTLQFQGTCAAINHMDAAMCRESKSVRSECAKLLVDHLHRELVQNIVREIGQREQIQPPICPIVELVEPRPWLFAESGFQVDPSHLAATIRLGRMALDRGALEKGAELSWYGTRLDPTLIGRGPFPFDRLFEAHHHYFTAALGQDGARSLGYFRQRLEQDARDVAERKEAAMVIVDLLCRRQNWDEALELSLDELAGEQGSEGIVPSAVEIAKRAGNTARLVDWYRAQGDLLRYGLLRIEAPESESPLPGQ